MFRYLALTVAACFAATVAFCQTQPQAPRAFIGLSGGTGIPMGDFSNTNTKNKKASYATPGSFAELQAGHLVYRNLGIATVLRAQSNSFEKEELADGISKELPDAVDGTIEASKWKLQTALAGAYYTLPFGTAGVAALELRALAGAAHATSPALHVTAESTLGSGWAKQESVSASAFAYQAGAALRFRTSARMALTLQADYFHTKPEFKNVHSSNSLGQSKTETYKREIAMLNVGLGVTYLLR